MKKKLDDLLNFKNKEVLKIITALILLIIIFISSLKYENTNTTNTLNKGSVFEDTTINEVFLNENGIKFSVKEEMPIYKKCYLLDKNLNEIEDSVCSMPYKSSIGYVKTKNNKYDNIMYLGLEYLEIDVTSNWEDEEVLNKSQLNFEEDRIVYLLDLVQMKSNNSSQLLTDFPTPEELSKQVEEQEISYLKSKIGEYDQQLQVINGTKNNNLQKIKELVAKYETNKDTTEGENLLLEIDFLNKRNEIIDVILKRYKILYDYKIFNNTYAGTLE